MLGNTFSLPLLLAGAVFLVCFGNDMVLARVLQPPGDVLKYRNAT
jgi:hypothetical protein